MGAEIAARMIYLNKTCFNGLYRVNLNGDFNVPFGRHPSTIAICNESQILRASEALQDSVVQSSDFSEALEDVQPGDVVYLDPPYTTAHTNNGFIEYNARVFSWEDQKRLASSAKTLVELGAHVFVSNADHYSITECYPETHFTIHRLERWSTMSGKSTKRFSTTELVIAGKGSRID